jgi:predicted metalloprotease
LRYAGDVTFRKNARLNPGQVRDLRGGGVALGGGLGGVILLVAVLLLGGDPSQIPSDLLNGTTVGTNQANDLSEECQTGEDANERKDCRIVGYVNSVQAYWQTELAADYQLAPTTFFTGGINTACGSASSAVGPFYCPRDQTVYIDLSFFDQLESQLGAEDGPLSEAYVIAHEYGHHVQNLLGDLEAGGGETGAGSLAVRVELQADCYAGIWMFHAVDTRYLEPITQAQIANAMGTAKAIGDDRIQQQTQGQVNPDSWTHGSADQRQEWLNTGLTSGERSDCNTFEADL